MADRVARALESTLKEVDAYRATGLFNEAEITSIVQQRTRFEYKCQRFVPIKADFLRYIQYELNLDALKKKRRTRLPVVEAQQDLVRLIDNSGIARVSLLFERLLRKFSGDVQVWLSYLSFLQSNKCNQLINRLFPRAHAVHPHSEELWLAHAAYESTTLGDIDSARVTFQRAIRLNPSSQLLFIKFFECEIHYIAKMMERRRILGINVKTKKMSKGDIDLRLRSDVTDMEVDELSNSIDEETDEADPNAHPLLKSDVALLQVLLPRAIARNAIERKRGVDSKYLIDRRKRRKLAAEPPAEAEVANDSKQILSLVQQFLARVPDPSNPNFVVDAVAEQRDAASPAALLVSFFNHNNSTYLQRVDFTPLMNELIGYLHKYCSEEPEALIVLAGHQCSTLSQENEQTAAQMFQDAITQHSDDPEGNVAHFHIAFINHLQSRLQHLQSSSDSQAQSLISFVADHLEQAAVSAIKASSSVADPALIDLAVSTLIDSNHADTAVQACLDACNSNAASPLPWSHAIRASIAAGREVDSLIESASSKVDRKHAHEFWSLRLESLIHDESKKDQQVHKAFIDATTSCEDRDQLELLYLDWLHRRVFDKAITSAQLRQHIQSVKYPLSAHSLQTCIQFEMALRSQSKGADRVACETSLRSYFDKLLLATHDDWTVYESYIRTERMLGSHDRANRLLWKAHKTLDPADQITLDQALEVQSS